MKGESHIFDSKGNAEGKVRVLSSSDGESWKSVALFGKDKCDLRDPKLSITPDGTLMLTIGGSYYENRVLKHRAPQVSFSIDGEHWTNPAPAVFEKCSFCTEQDWLWRLVWHNGWGYGVVYNPKGVFLWKTRDGLNYEPVSQIPVSDEPNETTVRFGTDGKCYAVIRCAGNAAWAVSNYPYTEISQKKLHFLPVTIGIVPTPEYF